MYPCISESVCWPIHPCGRISIRRSVRPTVHVFLNEQILRICTSDALYGGSHNSQGINIDTHRLHRYVFVSRSVRRHRNHSPAYLCPLPHFGFRLPLNCLIHPLFLCPELLFGSDCISWSTEKPSAALEETGEGGGREG